MNMKPDIINILTKFNSDDDSCHGEFKHSVALFSLLDGVYIIYPPYFQLPCQVLCLLLMEVNHHIVV